MYFKNLQGLMDHVGALELSQGQQLMVFAGDESNSDIPELIKYLNDKKIEFFGGIYSGLLVGSTNTRTGFIVKTVEPVYSSLVLPFMMKFNLSPNDISNSTAIVLVDGLSSRMKDLTDTLFKKVGSSVKYVGGGAGYYNLEHKPCIFNNQGIFEDALYVCIVKSDSLVAVEHGWQKLRGPFYVTRSYDNVLQKLDNEDALEIYKQVIEEEENIMLFKEDFFAIAKDHPFGILQNDGRVIVRDPISMNDSGEIICVADIPEGSQVFVLKGDSDTLLDSSLNIADFCSQNAPKDYIPLLFNCISRAMFLENRFTVELSNIQKSLDDVVEGALSIGEIASKRNGELVIHNKSTVLALLYK